MVSVVGTQCVAPGLGRKSTRRSELLQFDLASNVGNRLCWLSTRNKSIYNYARTAPRRPPTRRTRRTIERTSLEYFECELEPVLAPPNRNHLTVTYKVCVSGRTNDAGSVSERCIVPVDERGRNKLQLLCSPCHLSLPSPEALQFRTDFAVRRRCTS